MNVYLVTEGKTEKPLYQAWIKFLIPSLDYVESILDIEDNHYSILTGGGYPSYFDKIKNAITDINEHGNIDAFFICIDSGEMDYKEKYCEIEDLLDENPCLSKVKIIVQHFCIETWLLGNRKIIPRNSQNQIFNEYRNVFDVTRQDPEMGTKRNREQSAKQYLSLAMQERNTSFKKATTEQAYFAQLIMRINETEHLSSFRFFRDGVVGIQIS